MNKNTFGNLFQVTVFGESHGPCIGAIIDGCPAGIKFDPALLHRELGRRRPGSNHLVSARKELDEFEILSGVFEGKTLGTPIALLVRNQDTRPEDYENLKNNPRTGHADDLWRDKFGHVDYRGGGRASGRETVGRVLGGAVAQMFLMTELPELRINSKLLQVGPLTCDSSIDDLEPHVKSLLASAKERGESYGALLQIQTTGVPRGLGQPLFKKLKSDLGSALLSVGSVNAIEFGAGFEATKAQGTLFHDGSDSKGYGGIRGGISTGEPIIVKVGIKPTASILDTAKQGRHDPCIALRATPVLEAMVNLVLADHILARRLDR